MKESSRKQGSPVDENIVLTIENISQESLTTSSKGQSSQSSLSNSNFNPSRSLLLIIRGAAFLPGNSTSIYGMKLKLIPGIPLTKEVD